MAIADEITRIQTAKADLKTSINAKTDSSHKITNELIDDYSAFVDSIQTGGGDISEYFEGPLLADGDINGWKRNFIKFPPLQVQVGATNFRYMFYGCPAKEIDTSLIDISNATRVDNMFYQCEKLETLDISHFDFSSIEGRSSSTSMTSFLSLNSSLKNLTFGINLGKGYTGSAHTTYAKLDLSASTLLTHASLMSVINNLYDISDKNTQDLVLGATNLAKLSSSEIAIATAKNWTVS